MKSHSLLLFPLLGLCSASVHAADFWVGAGNACDYQTIPDALAAARATPETDDTIRVAKDLAYTDQALLVTTSVSLIGGFPACDVADRDGRTVLEGNGREAVLAVYSDQSDGIEVQIDGLEIREGGADVDTHLWGGLVVTGIAHTYLRDSVIRNNLAFSTLNDVRMGGGITVQGARAILTIERSTSIVENTGNGDGGGILVDRGSLRIKPHGVTIHENDADRGGGIALVNGGTLSESTDPLDSRAVVPLRITANRGTRGGGGIYVTGANSMLLASEILILDNTSFDTNGQGGGILVENQGYAQLSSFVDPPFRSCPAEQECLSLSANASSRSGAALAVRSGGTARLDGVIVRRNAFLGEGAGANAFLIDGTASSLRLANSVVADNTCGAQTSECAVIDMIAGANGSRLYFSHTTFARNANEGGALVSMERSEQGVNVAITGVRSLIADKELLDSYRGAFRPEVARLSECLLMNRGTENPAADISVGPITFQNPDGGNYRLAAGNVAIDYCSAGNDPLDLDRRPRGVDEPNHPDRSGNPELNGFYDLGAYEFHAVYDRVFADGFDTRP